jgi:hypothetical protein
MPCQPHFSWFDHPNMNKSLTQSKYLTDMRICVLTTRTVESSKLVSGRLWKSLVTPEPGIRRMFTGTNSEFMFWRDSFL